MRLRMFGAYQIEEAPGGEVGELLAQPKVAGLLCYLLLARPRGMQPRNRLVGMFFSEFDQEHARGALRNLLSRLRQASHEDLIDVRGKEFIGILPGLIWCDALAFEQALAEDRLREALELYHGDLLPDFSVDQAGEFERWLEDERAYYRSRAVSAAWELVQRYAAESELTNAGHLARVVARLAPTDERLIRRVMTMLCRLGDRAGAIEVFTKFSTRLRKDLELSPSPETSRLADAIRNGTDLPN